MDREIRVLLVDDEAAVRGSIRALLAEYEPFRVAGEAACGSDALALLAEQPVDVVFSDIQMPGSSGFALAEAVHRQYPDILVVFLTGYADFALDGYVYGPVDFLVKPVSRERLAQALERVRDRLRLQAGQPKPVHIGLRTDEGYRILDVGEIAYLEKENRSVKVVGKDGAVVHTGKVMQELEEMLLDYGFFRCHQSYLVPLRDIQEIQKESFGRSYRLRLRGVAATLPLSRGKFYELRDALRDNGLRQL